MVYMRAVLQYGLKPQNILKVIWDKGQMFFRLDLVLSLKSMGYGLKFFVLLRNLPIKPSHHKKKQKTDSFHIGNILISDISILWLHFFLSFYSRILVWIIFIIFQFSIQAFSA